MAETARYRVLRKIAHGGMAEIFLALQLGAEGFQKQVVLKRILPALAADPSFVRMLVDEAHIASTLNHSNLVQVLDLRHHQNEYFLVLEFVDGWSLEQVRRRAQKAKLKLPLPLALYIVGSLCRALAYVHTRTRAGRPLGIVHRDVTPQNLLVSAEGEVKLADFGIAKAAGKREKSATGVIKGKFAYMSPEQAAGEPLDSRSDLFSVGTVAYLLTTGKKPFDGATDLDVIMQVRKARYEKPSTFMRDFNPEVERFIARALRANRETRWQTAEQMADRIEAISSKLGQPAGPTALKRWLDTLTARDGIKSAAHAEGVPAELAPPPSASTIEVVSGDIELEVVTVGDHQDDDDAPPAASPPALAQPAPVTTVATRAVYAAATVVANERSRRLAEMTRQPPGSAATWEQAAALELPETPEATEAIETAADSIEAGQTPEMVEADPATDVRTDDERPVSPPEAMAPRRSLSGRLARWVARLALRTFLLLALLLAAGYFARPYLPVWVTSPVEGWLRRLPRRVNGLFNPRGAAERI